MILAPADITNIPLLTAEVAVVGAGPAGIVVALELAERGVDVLIIESGSQRFSAEAQKLSDASEWDQELHAPMSLTTRRQIGGTSVIWGGRCVPYDRIDFDVRSTTGNAEWPVTYDDIQPYFQRSCDWLQCGHAVFDATTIPHLPDATVPGLKDTYALTSTLERWSLPTNFGRAYRRRIEAARRLRLVAGLTCARIVCSPSGSRVDHLKCRTLAHADITVRAQFYVIAAGGLETTRLLLNSPTSDGHAIGDHSGHLGRWYMGHVEGLIANVRFTTDPHKTVFGYERDTDGVYVKRRFSFTQEFLKDNSLPNIVAWLTNPPLSDPRHGSAILSAAYLALASPAGRFFAPDAQRLALIGEHVPGSPYGPSPKGSVPRHLQNILSHPQDTASFVMFGVSRVLRLKRGDPGFSFYSAENLYPFQYHAEHFPHHDSRVTLAQNWDALGIPRLNIRIAFAEDDVLGVIRAHQLWDRYLREQRLGRLEYLYDDLESAVRRLVGGGFHQVGTTRMSRRPGDGVVDDNLFVHGLSNLAVASSSTFVTSGQANSTFMIIAFCLRLGDHLYGRLRDRH